MRGFFFVNIPACSWLVQYRGYTYTEITIVYPYLSKVITPVIPAF
jgi:hypothetical protein